MMVRLAILVALVIPFCVAFAMPLRHRDPFDRRRWILRGHGLFIGAFGLGMITIVEAGTMLFGWRIGPFAFFNEDPQALMGFIEAHGLAVCMAGAMFAASALPRPPRAFSGVGVAVGLLLFGANTLFWEESFHRYDFEMGYYPSTGLHLAFGLLHLWSLISSVGGDTAGGAELGDDPVSRGLDR